MKVLKKIGVGIISLGLISTFYIPEAKASKTIVEFRNVDGELYAIKLKNSGQHILKKVGSGRQECKMFIINNLLLSKFMECVGDSVGYFPDYDLVYDLLSNTQY